MATPAKGASVQGYLEQAAKELAGQEILVQGQGAQMPAFMPLAKWLI